MNVRALAILAAFGALVGASGCGIKLKEKSKSALALETGCFLPDDQSATLIAHWSVGPVPLAWQTGTASEFSATEIRIHTLAADTWNRFFEESKGGKVFDYGTADNPFRTSMSPPAYGVCPQRLYTMGGTAEAVSVHKMSSGWEYGSEVIAVTTFCTDSGSPFPRISGAAMKFNYQDFGAPGAGKRTPDWQTVALHEQGHLLGLDHSCESGSTKAGMPACETGANAYVEAVMFPSLYINGSAITRQALDLNTQQRANCLYGI